MQVQVQDVRVQVQQNVISPPHPTPAPPTDVRVQVQESVQ